MEFELGLGLTCSLTLHRVFFVPRSTKAARSFPSQFLCSPVSFSVSFSSCRSLNEHETLRRRCWRKYFGAIARRSSDFSGSWTRTMRSTRCRWVFSWQVFCASFRASTRAHFVCKLRLKLHAAGVRNHREISITVASFRCQKSLYLRDDLPFRYVRCFYLSKNCQLKGVSRQFFFNVPAENCRLYRIDCRESLHGRYCRSECYSNKYAENM